MRVIALKNTDVSMDDSIETIDKELIAILKSDGMFELGWQVAEVQMIEGKIAKKQIEFQQEIYKRFLNNAYESLFYLGFIERKAFISESLNYLRLVAAAFVRNLSKNPDIKLLREKTIIEIADTDTDIDYLVQSAPYLIGAEYLNENWIKQAWKNLNNAFSNMIKYYEGSVEEFFASLNPNVHLAGRVFFHLVESKKDEFPFAFLATYSTDISTDGKSRHLPLKNALVEYGTNSKKLLELLSTVNKASENSTFITEIVESGEIFHPLGLTTNEAYTFLKEVPIYEEAGVLCRIPNWWKTKSDSLRMSISVGDKKPSRLNFDAIVDFNAELSLNGESIDADELKRLLSEAEGLAFIKGKWIEVNHEKLKETLEAYEQAQKLMNKTDMSMIDAMKFQLNAKKMLNIQEESCELEVTNGQWLNSVISNLTHPDTIEPVTCGDDFHAILRTYQERGVSWLNL